MKNYSQNNEQEVILNYIKNKNLTTGKFLEIGAFDGENFSNVKGIVLTYPEWKGTMIEPSSFCFSKLFEMYRTEENRIELVNAAVVLEKDLSNETLLEFYESPLSAVSSSIKTNVEKFNSESRKIYVSKIGMKELLKKFGPFQFISIDVEGYSAELALQDWFDPRDYGCMIIAIEPDRLENLLVEKFTKLGYLVIGYTGDNIIFGLI
jgi:FkbM family methyltransferase